MKRLKPALLPAALTLLALLSLSAQAQAQERPQGPALETTWEVSLKGKPVGKEVSRQTRVKGGFQLESRGHYEVTSEPFDYVARLRWQGIGAVSSYSLSSAKIRASARRTPEGIKHSVTYGSGEEGVVSESLASTKGSTRPVILLDTLCFSHYELVGRAALAHKHAAFTFLALTPQTKSFPSASFTPGESSELQIAGSKRAVRTGTVTLGALRATLSYDQETGRVYRVSDSQGYVAETGLWPRAFREQEVEIPQTPGALQGSGPIRGTLTLPGNSKGPFPTLLILPGSGPQDRDSTIGPNKPLRDLSRALAGLGVASLRCDKAAFRFRAALTSGDPAVSKAARERFVDLTFEDEYQRDALPCLDWLAARSDTRELVLCGHSMGAVAAAEIAALSSQVSGVVLLAGPARRTDELLAEQTRYQLGLRNTPQAQIDGQLKQIEDAFALIRKGALPAGRNIMGAPVRYWKDLLTRPLPPKVLRGLKQPVLVLQGGKDCQVRGTDFELLKTALEAREAPHQAVLLPELNHLFMPCKGPSTGQEYLLEGTLDPRVPQTLAIWLRRRFPK